MSLNFITEVSTNLSIKSTLPQVVRVTGAFSPLSFYFYYFHKIYHIYIYMCVRVYIKYKIYNLYFIFEEIKENTIRKETEIELSFFAFLSSTRP